MDTSTIQIPISEEAAYRSRVHVGLTISLLALCIVPFSARLYIRTWPKWNFWWDDFFIVLGFVLAIADWILLQFEIFLTPQLLSFARATLAMELAYLAIPVWCSAMTCIKVSVTLTLLRLPLGTSWKIFLYTIAGIQVAYFIGNQVYTFVACIPLSGIWDMSVTDARCLGPHSSVIASNVGSSINTLIDVILSVTPMVLVWQLRRPLREKLLVCVLTGFGLLASASSIAKALFVRKWGDPSETDTWALVVTIATLTMAEQFCAILAACSPSLKGPIQRALRSMGVSLTKYNSRISFVNVGRTRVAVDPEVTPEEKRHESTDRAGPSRETDESVSEGSVGSPRGAKDGDVEAQRA